MEMRETHQGVLQLMGNKRELRSPSIMNHAEIPSSLVQEPRSSPICKWPISKISLCGCVGKSFFMVFDIFILELHSAPDVSEKGWFLLLQKSLINFSSLNLPSSSFCNKFCRCATYCLGSAFSQSVAPTSFIKSLQLVPILCFSHLLPLPQSLEIGLWSGRDHPSHVFSSVLKSFLLKQCTSTKRRISVFIFSRFIFLLKRTTAYWCFKIDISPRNSSLS